MRMPTGSLLANAAYMICARLAFKLKSWLAQLSALPDEVMRWEWKRFRYNFVIIAATVTKQACACPADEAALLAPWRDANG